MSEQKTPHRPPKYVDGVYKPHFGDPDADYAVFIWPLDPWEEPHLATTDSDGDAAGVVRYNGKPLTEGGSHIVGHVYDGEIELREFWKDRVDVSDLL